MSDHPVPQTSSAAFRLWAALLAAAVLLWAASLGSDASWDTRNYHLYNPFALLEKAPGWDIAPAHLQTFLSPTLDLPFYLLVKALPLQPALNAALAVPQALALVLALALTWRLTQPRNWLEGTAVAGLVALSGTGAAAGSTIATAMSEMLPAAFFVMALLVLIQRDLWRRPSLGRVFAAGLLAGVACGLKLTLSYATAAFALALLVVPRTVWWELAARPVLFGLGVPLGAAATSGYWWVMQWQRWGNPLFPYMNNVFRSPFAIPADFVDRTFLPKSLGDAVQAPWNWTLGYTMAVGESHLRDPRFAGALIGAALVLLVAISRRRGGWPWPALFIASWFLIGFALWRLQFSIFRYLTTLELFTGTVAALLVVPVARLTGRPIVAPVLAAGLLALCAALTVYPNTNRSPPGAPAFSVRLPAIEPDSLVLFLNNEPMGYLAAFIDPRARVVGTNDYFMTLRPGNPLQAQVASVIAGHAGPIWGLEGLADPERLADATLDYHGLRRESCQPVATNVSPEPIRICRLARAAPGAKDG